MQTTEASIADLPLVVLHKIFQFLSPAQLNTVAQCSRWCLNATNVDRVWLHCCIIRGWMCYQHLGDTQCTSACQPQPSSEQSPSFKPARAFAQISDYEPCYWKQIFFRAAHLKKNWRLVKYAVHPTLHGGHTERITALDSADGLMVSSSADGTVSVWDLSCLTVKAFLRVTKHSIECCRLRAKKLAIGTSDGYIVLYDTTTFSRLFTIPAHEDAINKLEFTREDDSHLISISNDGSVKLWSLSPPFMKFCMVAHFSEVECIVVDRVGQVAFTGSQDGLVICWNMVTGEKLSSLTGHAEAIYCIALCDQLLISGSADCTLRVWNTVTATCSNELIGHSGEVYCVAVLPSALRCASGSADSTVRVWDLPTGDCISILQEHIGIVRSLYIDEHRLISAGDRKRVVVWDLYRGVSRGVLHRNPILCHLMICDNTRIIVASPEKPGSIVVMTFW